MRIRLKFNADANEAERLRVLGRLAAVEQLFPGHEDPELSSLYVAEADTRLLAAVKRSPAVEFAEPEAERWLS